MRLNYAGTTSAVVAILFLVASVSASAADEECLYDQVQQRHEYQMLEARYPGSRFVEAEQALVIPTADGDIHLRIGGCVHYGVTIERWRSTPTKAESREALFKTIVGLVRTYGQGMADAERLGKLLAAGRYTDLSDRNGPYYMVRYPDFAAFEIYRRSERERSIVGVSFYN